MMCASAAGMFAGMARFYERRKIDAAWLYLDSMAIFLFFL